MAAEKPPVTVGVVGGRVGPIAIVGEGIGEAAQDWFEMVNAQGGINGRQVNLVEVESEYSVPKGLEAYAQLKNDGAVLIAVEGTAISDALTPASATDQIPILFPGQGNLDTVDGVKYPYAFPAGPLYAHQASALVAHLTETTDGVSITCVAWEAAAGREYCAGVQSAADATGTPFISEVIVGAQAADVSAQVTEAAKSGASHILHSTIFGQAVLLMKGLCEEAPNAVIGTWHWSINQNEINGAGAECAEGLIGTSMSALPPSSTEAGQMLMNYWSETGQTPNPVMESNSLYANGLYFATLMEEAIRQADAIAGDGDITGEMVKNGMEKIAAFTGYGVACPITITPTDHSGNRALNVYEIESGTWKLLAPCVTGPPIPGEPAVS